jgi:dihydroxyacetone kinase-like protein
VKERQTTRVATDVATEAENVLELREDGHRVAAVAGTRVADLDVRRVLAWWRGFEDQVSSRGEELRGLGPELEEAAGAADAILAKAPPVLAADVFDAVAVGFASVPGLPTLLGPWFAEFARSCGREAGTHEPGHPHRVPGRSSTRWRRRPTPSPGPTSRTSPRWPPCTRPTARRPTGPGTPSSTGSWTREPSW